MGTSTKTILRYVSGSSPRGATHGEADMAPEKTQCRALSARLSSQLRASDPRRAPAAASHARRSAAAQRSAPVVGAQASATAPRAARSARPKRQRALAAAVRAWRRWSRRAGRAAYGRRLSGTVRTWWNRCAFASLCTAAWIATAPRHLSVHSCGIARQAVSKRAAAAASGACVRGAKPPARGAAHLASGARRAAARSRSWRLRAQARRRSAQAGAPCPRPHAPLLLRVVPANSESPLDTQALLLLESGVALLGGARPSSALAAVSHVTGERCRHRNETDARG